MRHSQTNNKIIKLNLDRENNSIIMKKTVSELQIHAELFILIYFVHNFFFMYCESIKLFFSW